MSSLNVALLALILTVAGIMSSEGLGGGGRPGPFGADPSKEPLFNVSELWYAYTHIAIYIYTYSRHNIYKYIYIYTYTS